MKRDTILIIHGHDMYHNGYWSFREDGVIDSFHSVDTGVVYPATEIDIQHRLDAMEVRMDEGDDWDGYMEDVVAYVSWSADVTLYPDSYDVDSLYIEAPTGKQAPKDYMADAINDKIHDIICEEYL